MDATYTAERVLDRAERANDEYPPIQGRVLPGDVLFEFTAGGVLSGDVHPALRHFTIGQGGATQIDPVAARPRDFVLEWLAAPWEESRAHSASPSLQTWHTELHRTDGVGDFAEPTRRCTSGPDLWQVGTRLYEGPKRYYRVRWPAPLTFALVGVSEKPYADCTVTDERGEEFPNVLGSNIR